jgi:hypothetical protein
MLPLAFVLMQFIVSAKAGLVNYVDGQANVHLHEQIPAGKLIETSPKSHVEVLLNPGSFLRIGEDSAVVFDSVELTKIFVRIISGEAIVEAADIDKHTPIRVTTGGLTVSLLSSGIYRFSGATAVVLDGKLRTADSSKTVKKGEQITKNRDQYEETKVPLSAASYDDLEAWSRQRSFDVARANALAYNGQTGAVFYPFSSMNGAAWMYSSLLGGFTFIPRNYYRSYWGYGFLPVFAYAPTVYGGWPGGGGFSTSRPPAQTSSSQQTSSTLMGSHNAPRPPTPGSTSRAPTFSGFGGAGHAGGGGGAGAGAHAGGGGGGGHASGGGQAGGGHR